MNLLDLAFSREFPGQDVPEEVEQAVFDLKSGFKRVIEDDVELYRFWPTLFRFIRQVNLWISERRLTGAGARLCYKQLMNVDSILCILDHRLIPLPEIELPGPARDLIKKREQARANRDFTTSDALREEIAQAGFRVFRRDQSA